MKSKARELTANEMLVPSKGFPTLISQQSLNSISKPSENEAVIFDNQIPLMTVTEFCSRFGYSKKTIYDWKYRPKKNKVPQNLIVKIRGKVFVRTDVYRSLVPF